MLTSETPEPHAGPGEAEAQLVAVDAGSAEAAEPAQEDAQSEYAADKLEPEQKQDIEQFSGLPIVNRTVPAEMWAREVLRPDRRYVSFSHIPLYLGAAGNRMRSKENIIIGVLYHSSAGETRRLGNGEQFLRWRLTDLAQQARQIVVQLRWGAYLHWRNGKPASLARRGAILAILNPHLVEVADGHPGTSKEMVIRIEKALQVEKLGDCPALGSCKKPGCKDPCDIRQRERYCRNHRNIAYAEKTVPRISGGGGADSRMAALLRTRQKKSSQKVAQQLKASLLEAHQSDSKKELAEDKQRQEKLNKLELAKAISERQLTNQADANENYVRCIRNGLKAEDSLTSRIPVLGRGLNSSSTLEVTISSTKRSRDDDCDELEIF